MNVKMQMLALTSIKFACLYVDSVAAVYSTVEKREMKTQRAKPLISCIYCTHIECKLMQCLCVRVYAHARTNGCPMGATMATRCACCCVSSSHLITLLLF